MKVNRLSCFSPPVMIATFGVEIALAFIVPTTAVNLINPATLAGIPSIMCGFAVLLAIILAGEVLPSYYSQPALSSLQQKIAGIYGKISG